MSNANKVADDIKGFVKKFKWMQEAAEYLEKVGSLEQAERDANKRKENAYKEAEEASLMADKKKLELAKASAELEEIKNKSLETEQLGNKRFSDIVKEAKEKAEQIVNEANANKSVILNEIELKVTAHNKVLEDIERAKVELAGIETQIKDMKNKIAALGG